MKNSDKKKDFSVPEGYFENATERFLSKVENIRYKNSKEDFKVPSGYFEDLNTKIAKKINKDEAKVIQLNPIKKYYYAVAAIAAVIVMFFVLKINDNQELSFGFDDLAYSDIETYFESNKLGFTSYEIAEFIPVDQVELNDILIDGLNEENILEYLTNNTDSFYELNLENDE